MHTDTTAINAPLITSRRGLLGVLERVERATHGLVGLDSLRTALLLATARVGGPVLSIVVAAVYGASLTTDRFFVAFAIATYVVETVTAITEATAVPFLVAARIQDRVARSAVARLALSSAAAAALIGFPVSVLLRWSRVLPDYGEITGWLGVLAAYVLVSSAASALTGSLYAARRYAIAAASAGLRPIVALGVIAVVGHEAGIGVLALGLTLGAAGQFALLAIVVRRTYSSTASGTDPWRGARRFLREAGWQLAGSLTLGLLPVVDRLVASGLTAGSVSLLEYCTRVWSFPVTLLLSGALVVCLTNWSELGLTDAGQLRRTVRGASGAMLLISLPVASVMVFFRDGIVGIVLGWGSLRPDQLAEAAATFGVLAAGLPLYLVGLLYARALVAVRQSRWLFVAAVAALAAKTSLNALLAPAFGVPGVALATSITFAGVCALVAMAFHRSVHHPRST